MSEGVLPVPGSTAKLVVYFDQIAKVDCDRNCAKAWGRQSRPHEGEELLADGEAGEAPVDPGTYEGGEAKPISPSEFPNKWCIRECERCAMSDPGAYTLPLRLPDLTTRQPR